MNSSEEDVPEPEEWDDDGEASSDEGESDEEAPARVERPAWPGPRAAAWC